MRRVLKAIANDLPIGDLTTLEDKTSVEEIVRSYQTLERVREEKKRKPGKETTSH